MQVRDFENKQNKVIVYLFLFFGLALIPVAICTRAFLFRDGAVHLFHLLESKLPFDWDTPRQMAHSLLHAPLWFAIDFLDIKNLSALVSIYGASLYYIPFLIIAASSALAYRFAREIFLVPVIWYIYAFGFSFLYALGESTLACCVFWLVFVAQMSLKKNSNYFLGLTALLGSYFLLQIHEGSLLFFPLLLICSWPVVREFYKTKKFFLLSLSFITVLLNILGLVIAFKFVFSPEIQARIQVSVLAEFFAFLYSGYFIALHLGVLLILLIARMKLQKPAVAVILLVYAGLVGFYFVRFPDPKFYYFSRYWLFGSSFLAAAFILRPMSGRKQFSFFLLPGKYFNIFLLIVSFNIAQFIVTEYDWTSFLQSLKTELTGSSSSLVSAEDTHIEKKYYLEYWNTIELSYLVGALTAGKIETVIVEPGSLFYYYKSYKQLNPPDLSAYNIKTTVSYKSWGHQ
ncbi:MAG: hypothetical protein ACXVAX_07865 [Pseudobdellovibrio sp.]